MNKSTNSKTEADSDPAVAPITGYSWTKDQLETYEQSWAREHDHQH